MPECLLRGWVDQLDEVIIALPELSSTRARHLARLLRRTGVKVYQAASPLVAYQETPR